jgi:hypothetical protein
VPADAQGMDWGVRRLRDHAAPPEVAIIGDDGQVFAELYLAEGSVELDDPARLDEAAQRFWDKIQDLAESQRHRRRTDVLTEPYPVSRRAAVRRILHRV